MFLSRLTEWVQTQQRRHRCPLNWRTVSPSRVTFRRNMAGITGRSTMTTKMARTTASFPLGRPPRSLHWLAPPSFNKGSQMATMPLPQTGLWPWVMIGLQADGTFQTAGKMELAMPGGSTNKGSNKKLNTMPGHRRGHWIPIMRKREFFRNSITSTGRTMELSGRKERKCQSLSHLIVCRTMLLEIQQATILRMTVPVAIITIPWTVLYYMKFQLAMGLRLLLVKLQISTRSHYRRMNISLLILRLQGTKCLRPAGKCSTKNIVLCRKRLLKDRLARNQRIDDNIMYIFIHLL